jgi:hypothetical protein
MGMGAYFDPPHQKKVFVVRKCLTTNRLKYLARSEGILERHGLCYSISSK